MKVSSLAGVLQGGSFRLEGIPYFYIFLPGWYPQYRLQPDLFRRLTLRAFHRARLCPLRASVSKGANAYGAMPLADLRPFRDNRRRTRRNRESTGKGGSRTDGPRHTTALSRSARTVRLRRSALAVWRGNAPRGCNLRLFAASRRLRFRAPAMMLEDATTTGKRQA